MRSRLDDLPRYSSRSYEMPAEYYNQVRVALLRVGTPQRFVVPGLRTLEMVLEEDAWIVVDSGLNDYPVLAWVEFETARREALHAPMHCKLYTYHAHAEIVIERILTAIKDHSQHLIHSADVEGG
jgi:hypothetical protein